MPKSIFSLIAILIAIISIPYPTVGAQDPQPTEVFLSYLPLIINASPSGQTPEQIQLAQEILALVNNERVAAGCAALTLQDQLSAAAQRQSDDMAIYNFFDHINPDPTRTTIGMRVTAVGYIWSRVGENIAVGYRTSAEVVQGWMQSDGHRENILNCAYTQMGAGYHYQADDQILPDGTGPYYRYWTQVLATPR